MQLSTLQDVYAHPGPYVTVHLDVSRNSENAAQQLDARWTNARQELERQGVDKELIDEIGERVHQQVEVPGEVRRTIIAAADHILFDDVLAGDTPWPDTATYGDLPDLSPWLQQVDGQVPFLLVVADREGADLDLYRALARHQTSHAEVDGKDLHLHKFQGGGWAHRRFQQRSENQWESNAKDVAEEIRSTVAKHRPRVILVAGDQRAQTLITDAIGEVPAEVLQLESGGRAAGASEDALMQEVEAVLARVQAEDQQQLTGRLEEKWGQGSGAVLGVDAVLEALVQHQVDTLIVDLQKAHDITVDATRFPGLPVPETVADKKGLRADQVLVAAGAATDTAIAVLPAELSKGGGIAAILRWDD